MMHPLDQIREVMSEPLVQVTLGEQTASLHTDPDRGWIWMLHMNPNDWNLIRVRRSETCEFTSARNRAWRFLAGHMPDDAESVEIAEAESAASASGNGVWLAILRPSDAATVRFLGNDQNVVREYTVTPYRSSRMPRRLVYKMLNPFMRRGRHTFRSR